MASLTETAKAVLEGKNQIDEGYGINYPSVGNGGTSNPNPVDPSTASTGNAKTLRPGSKSVEGRHANPGASVVVPNETQDLGGQTPTQLPTENLGAKAAKGEKRDTSVKGSGSNAEPSKKLSEDEEAEGNVVAETSLAERVKALKEARKSKKEDDKDDADDTLSLIHI